MYTTTLSIEAEQRIRAKTPTPEVQGDTKKRSSPKLEQLLK